ncbi:hypothetical protein EXIGLDRAFT_724518 [Exidia glandulosa HHB12029]|uniref:F-box domain-containing protein n=1 Tax=Exidia glandulosa HHB12029 TaxID=1314781 RepID=A0A165EDM5_EXIGL|nr:hypothetical protein EXIGLDRAFT_724518 [Exidia glandulosa HHB12029]
MTGRDLTDTLPPELIRRFFRGWTFEELHPMLGVCARWREIGLNHPIYWRSIMFDDCTDGAARLALLRIERTCERPFYLEIWASRDKELLYEVLSVLSNCLERIVSLGLFVPRVHAAATFGALLQPAPKLEALQLEFKPLDADLKGPIMIPSGLFACHAPALRSVRLCGVRLVERLHIFHRVSDVCIIIGSDDLTAVPCAFTHFPSTRRLQFLWCSNLSQSQHAPDSFWSELDKLELSGTPEGISSAIHDLPFYAIRNVFIYPGSSQFGYICSHFRGDLDLALVSDHQYDHVRVFLLGLTERSTQRSRMFLDHWKWWKEGTSSATLYDLRLFAVVERVVTLCLSADIIPAACARLPPLPNVVEIAILFHSWGFSGATPVQPLLVPKLRSLRLRGHDDLPTVSRCLLHDICVHALSGYVPPLTVTADQVIIPRNGDVLNK